MKDGVYIVKQQPTSVMLLKGGRYIYLKHKAAYKVFYKYEYVFDEIFSSSEDVTPISVKYYFDLITKDSI